MVRVTLPTLPTTIYNPKDISSSSPAPYKMGRVTLPTTSYNPKDILPCSKAELRTIFMKHDDNKDGKLSWEEVKAAYKELGSHWPWLVTEDGFRHADLDDDGYIDIETELELLVAHASKFNYKSRNVIYYVSDN